MLRMMSLSLIVLAPIGWYHGGWYRRRVYGRVEELLDQGVSAGGCAAINVEGRPIFYLVTKPWSQGQPLYRDVRSSLEEMRSMSMRSFIEHGIERVAMPKIGSGVDQLDWEAFSMGRALRSMYTFTSRTGSQ